MFNVAPIINNIAPTIKKSASWIILNRRKKIRCQKKIPPKNSDFIPQQNYVYVNMIYWYSDCWLCYKIRIGGQAMVISLFVLVI